VGERNPAEPLVTGTELDDPAARLGQSQLGDPSGDEQDRLSLSECVLKRPHPDMPGATPHRQVPNNGGIVEHRGTQDDSIDRREQLVPLWVTEQPGGGEWLKQQTNKQTNKHGQQHRKHQNNNGRTFRYHSSMGGKGEDVLLARLEVCGLDNVTLEPSYDVLHEKPAAKLRPVSYPRCGGIPGVRGAVGQGGAEVER